MTPTQKLYLDNINDDILMKDSASAVKNVLLIESACTVYSNTLTVHGSKKYWLGYSRPYNVKYIPLETIFIEIFA